MSTEEIQKYLQDNKVYADVWEEGTEVVVSIEWGDWKHDHLYCIHLMQEKGYRHVSEIVTEEDGSDTYSAEHYFEKPLVTPIKRNKKAHFAKSTLQNKEKRNQNLYM